MIAAYCALNGQTGHDAGRELLRRLYELQTGKALPEIRYTNRGKPFFTDSALHFSISHTNRHAFCVLSQCPVGLDAEETDRKISPVLVRKVLSPTEMARFTAAGGTNEAFLALWVLKEASAKLTGEGLQGFPNHTDFSPDDPRVIRWGGCIAAIIAADADEGVQFYAF